MQKKLKELCNKLIEENKDEEKYQTILKLLEEEQCFFKLSIEDSISILMDLGFTKEEALNIYTELIDSKHYKKNH